MKTLLVDYSWSNTTAQLATVVQQVTGAERLDLTVAKGTFPNDMYATSDVAQQQLASGDLPALTTPLPDLNQYTHILVGGPVWSGHVATPVRQFLRQLQNYTGTVAPFYTSAGTPGDYEADFASLMPQVSVATGLGLTASDLPNAQSQVTAWWEKMAR
ncbi:flavodoxin [Levilactobacillus brevis]|uniref:flavodoxin n=1 Tax=Levilactobacillus brevis TaxID=1580 RepID=UPI002073DFED|nr:flavodoxin [Levilactobacillus brevis]MCM6796377.1 flavodoxin [Levilactobacillus brevis]